VGAADIGDAASTVVAAAGVDRQVLQRRQRVDLVLRSLQRDG